VAIGLGLLWLLIGWKAARNTLSQILLLIPTVIAVPIGVWSIVTFAREATPGLALTNPYLPDDVSLAAGKGVFEANCAVCHGEQGRGNGPAAATLSVQPPDFGSGHLDIHTDGDVFYWIQNGPSPTSPMPAFKATLSEDEIWHLVNTVRRLRNEATSVGAGPRLPGQVSPAPAITRGVAALRRRVLSRTARRNANHHADGQAVLAAGSIDAVMNALTSSEDQVVTMMRVMNCACVEYNAPDRCIKLRTATSIQIGGRLSACSMAWLQNARTAFAWPNFNFAKVATEAGWRPMGRWCFAITTLISGGD
jgi:mono/diheme cytochrome c family protein